MTEISQVKSLEEAKVLIEEARATFGDAAADELADKLAAQLEAQAEAHAAHANELERHLRGRTSRSTA